MVAHLGGGQGRMNHQEKTGVVRDWKHGPDSDRDQSKALGGTL